MINKNELRIGATFINNSNGLFEDGEYVILQLHHFYWAFETGQKLEALLKPIPLTPEIFLSCGFIEGAMLENSFINDELRFDLIEGHYYLRDGAIDNFSRPIDFLHQLQNINLDLTGEELEIKELQHA